MEKVNEEENISQTVNINIPDKETVHPVEKENALVYSIENDPLFKPIDKDKKEKIDKAVEKKVASISMEQNLARDDTRVPGQNYALISIVSPHSNQKHDQCCVKIKGVFEKVEDAKEHAKMLQKIDPTFDIYVVDMYAWLLVPPKIDDIEQVHVDNKLNEIIAGHRDNQLKSKMYFEERKRELMENIELENEERKEKNKKELETKIKATNQAIVNNTLDLGECPSSTPVSEPSSELETTINKEEESSPSELMDSMLKDKNLNPRQAWGDLE